MLSVTEFSYSFTPDLLFRKARLGCEHSGASVTCLCKGGTGHGLLAQGLLSSFPQVSSVLLVGF